ncbi:hypothetical protein ACFL2O_09715 [Thermodesulfobacteriota bacterium]
MISGIFDRFFGKDSGELYFVDAHSQVDEHVPDLSLITRRMSKSGVRKTILAPRGFRTHRQILDFTAANPQGTIIPAIRTKGQAYTNDEPHYYENLDRHVRSNCFGALGEVLLYHAEKRNEADEVIADEVLVCPKNPQVEAAFNAAKEKKWPFVVHIEYAAFMSCIDCERSPEKLKKLKRFKRELEELWLLSSQVKHPIVLIHMAQMDDAMVGELLQESDSIYFMASCCNPIQGAGSNQPWTQMFKEETLMLKPEWKELITAYPKRFIFAIDNVWRYHWEVQYKDVVRLWRNALNAVPPNVSHAFAHGNAEQLWRLDEYRLEEYCR